MLTILPKVKSFVFVMAFFIIFRTFSAYAGVVTPKQFDYPEDHFSISLPSNWIEIPIEELEAFSETIYELAPNTQKQNFKYGFQTDNASYWLEYPYILVQIKKIGRISEKFDLNKLQKIIDNKVENIISSNPNLSSVMSDLEFNEPVYDPEKHILWTILSSHVQEVGSVLGILGMYLTEEGFINIACYTKARDFEIYGPICKNIIDSVQLSKEISYQPRFADNIPLLNRIDWEHVVAMAIVGALFGVFFHLFSRNRKI